MADSNIKPAPFQLTPALASKLVGDRPAYGAGIARIPLCGKLVDQPRAKNATKSKPSDAKEKPDG